MEGTWDRNRVNRTMRINRDESTGIVIDIQERLYPHMYRKDELLHNCLRLLEGFRILGIPVLRTEQYPKGLGTTLEPIKRLVQPDHPIEKISFSCCDEAAFRSELERTGRKTVILCGIETHVCILQTAVDLLEADYRPVVVTDCVSSRKEEDRLIALERMRTEGAVLTTCESVLFELARYAGTDEFKAISRLVK